MIVVPGFLAWSINRMRKAYWPILVFLIGQGAERHKKMQSRRDMWALGLIFPVLLTIAVALVQC